MEGRATGTLTTTRLGRHLVVHGPPGTGKSQTIANLIADAIVQGKKVLFVSAKMAALDVVHDRLTRLGLGRFCLEAHSTKAGKVKIVEELRQTLEASQDARGPSGDEELDDLLRVRKELNTYVREVHERREPLGLSIYQVLGRVEKLSGASEVRGALPWDDLFMVSRSELKEALEALGELAAQAEVFDRRAVHPWRGLAVDPDAPPRRDALEADILVRTPSSVPGDRSEGEVRQRPLVGPDEEDHELPERQEVQASASTSTRIPASIPHRVSLPA